MMAARALVLIGALGFAWLLARGDVSTESYLLMLILCSHAMQRIDGITRAADG
jgi:hypothetical protein